MNKRPKAKDQVTLKTGVEKLSRIIELSTYLTQKCINSDTKYQPHNEDEDQPFRLECVELRFELGIIDDDGKVIQEPNSQMPDKSVAQKKGE